MFGILMTPDNDVAVRRVRIAIGVVLLVLLISLLGFVTAVYMYAPLASKIAVTASLFSFSGFFFSAYMLENTYAERLVAWWRQPSKAEAADELARAEAAWTAEFDEAFRLEYPRWQEYVATGKYRSTDFKTIMDTLKAEWQQHRPAHADKLDIAAMWVVKGYRFGGDLTRGLGMHVLYRNWEVAQDTRRIKRGERTLAT